MDAVAIEVHGLSKQYQIGGKEKVYDRLGDQIFNSVSSSLRQAKKLLTGRAGLDQRDTIIWALKDVTFSVRSGEVVGIIGRNGAGKSTLLKILSRITEPTQGYANVYGRIGSLLEVGTGFHPELTGRENIYLNGSILGMGRGEIQKKLDEIIAFAEIDEFIDTPVKHYSSGMYVRLAFSVAAHLEPDILLVDEVLAVGDLAFQNKCLGKMNQVSSSGRTVLFVSHNMGVIQNLCRRGVVLQKGRVAFEGPIDKAVNTYLEYLNSTATHTIENNMERSGSGQVRLAKAYLLDETNRPSEHLVSGQPASFIFVYENPQLIRRVTMAFTVYNQLGIAATNFDMHLTDPEYGPMECKGKLICRVPNLPFPIGRYRVAVAIYINDDVADLLPAATLFDVVSSTFFESGRTPEVDFCSCMVSHTWEHVPLKNPES